ncbi:MAG: NHL repeat-containing protein [Planctomycetota bacterium]
MRATLVTLAAILASASGSAATIRSAGILANSGESGSSLVRFGPKGASGMGVVFDRYGTLWDRGGEGRLNRYALDGRLVAHYAIPRGNDRNRDRITIAGDTVVVRVGGRLHKIGVDARSGSSAKELGIEAIVSAGSRGERVACVDKERRLFLLDPASGERTDVCTLPFEPGEGLDLDGDGNIYVTDRHRELHKISGGRDVTDGWPKKPPGERPQVIEVAGQRHWYGHAWHGTIKRFDADLRPDPGVVQGGASGSFIGHLPQNSELTNGRGMAHVAGRLYAVSGLGGIMHLLEWKPGTRKMQIVRRIGSLPRLPGVGLDRDGRVFVVNGMYEWNDGPDAPQRFGMTADVCGQAVMLPNDNIVAPGVQYGNQPRVMYGRLTTEVRQSGHGKVNLSRDIQKRGCGTTVYKTGGRLVVLFVSREGDALLEQIDSGGKHVRSIGKVAIATLSPVRAWTTLAMKDPGTLLAAGDGHLIEFAPEGANWRETRRFNRAGGDDRQWGPRIDIAADSGRLWVSDTERHRVLCLDLTSGRHLATFGKTDAAGTGLDELSLPMAIAARGRRAVVFDSGNQRLVKLELE